MRCCCCESDMRYLRFFRKPPGRDAHGERGYVASRPGQSARFAAQLLVRASRLLLWADATVVAVNLRTNLEPAQAHLRPSMARPAPHHRPVNVYRHADRRAVQLTSCRDSLARITMTRTKCTVPVREIIYQCTGKKTPGGAGTHSTGS